mgnify:CR=1 FL=1
MCILEMVMSMIMHGLVFGELNDWKAFLKNIEVWKLYNESGEPEDFGTPSKRKAGIL